MGHKRREKARTSGGPGVMVNRNTQNIHFHMLIILLFSCVLWPVLGLRVFRFVNEDSARRSWDIEVSLSLLRNFSSRIESMQRARRGFAIYKFVSRHQLGVPYAPPFFVSVQVSYRSQSWFGAGIRWFY